MTEIAIIDWFGRCGTSVFSENTAIFISFSIKVPYCNANSVDTILHCLIWVFTVWQLLQTVKTSLQH